MKTFLITISVNVPYPKQFSYRIQARQVSTATAKALKNLKGDTKYKRINDYSIRIINLNSEI